MRCSIGELSYGKDHTSTSVVTEVSATVVSPSENSFSSALSSCSKSTSGRHNTHKHNNSYNGHTQRNGTDDNSCGTRQDGASARSQVALSGQPSDGTITPVEGVTGRYPLMTHRSERVANCYFTCISAQTLLALLK